MSLCATQGLIAHEDRVVVAVSGGKDSLVMLQALAESRSFVPITFRLSAVHIHPADISLNQDREGLKAFCKDLDVPYTELSVTTAQLPDKVNKGACFRCSWARRKALFTHMEAIGARKLAFGHHMDDAVETLLMNMTRHGEVSSFPHRMNMRKGDFSIIRPLLAFTEQEVIEYARLASIVPFEGSCPHESTNQREYYRSLLTQLERDNPAAKVNIFRSMKKIFPEHLPQ